MKKSACLSAIVVAVAAGSAMADARDFSSYFNDELFSMGDQLSYMSEEDRAAFRSERQQRMQNMSPAEREAVRYADMAGGTRHMQGADMGHDNMNRQRLRDGSAKGHAYRYDQGMEGAGPRYGHNAYGPAAGSGNGWGGGHGGGRGH